jgi:hypothetical protein
MITGSLKYSFVIYYGGCLVNWFVAGAEQKTVKLLWVAYYHSNASQNLAVYPNFSR